MFEYKFLDDNTVDVFVGKGWANWTRFTVKRANGKVFLTKIGGSPMNSDDYKNLCTTLAKGEK